MSCVTLSLRASSRGSVRTEIQGKNHSWVIDEPKAFGGEDTAPSPVEMLLGSLAGCISAAGHLIAQEMGICLKALDISIDGDINSQVFLGKGDGGRAGFRQIRVSLTADADWTPSQREGWLRQVKSRCPVIDNFAFPTGVEIDFA